MPVIPPNDERRVINPSENRFKVPPLPSITAIDTTLNAAVNAPFGFGTGVVISPNYVLTAAHNLLDKSFTPPIFQDEIRVSSSGNHQRIADRRIGRVSGDQDPNVNPATDLFLPFFDKYVSAEASSPEENKFDIGLIKLNDTDLISAAPPVSLIAFVASRTITETLFPIQTAGYPVDNIKNTFPSDRRDNPGIPDRQDNIKELPDPNNPNDFEVRARDLVLAPGTLNRGEENTGRVISADGRRIQYSENIDTVAGQSGSPVWSIIPEAEGENEPEPIPRVLGVHSRGGRLLNAGTLIDKEAYDLIIEEIEGEGNPNLLPENAIN